MHVLCLVGGHSAFPSSVRNQGFFFSRCRCCGRDMIRSNRGWKPVPRGFRVIWQRDSRPIIRNLPVPSTRRGGDHFARRCAALAELAGAGLRLAFWTLGSHYRAAKAALAASFRPAPTLLRLPAS